ncbi:MAG: DegT/DnrJ/EryC1/StrS family aminotransferase [Methanobacteriaceae archaeon]|nr:DegT/DnrJ/EryC1/StrS family aminotransferase [Methanobacteriaceae archaeon]
MGYNLKITDWQAAIGLAQMKKLPNFIDIRKKNFERMFDGFKSLEKYFILPEKSDKSEPSWFGFPITIKDDSPFNKLELVKYLEDNNIGTRQLFSGNILRQPLFLDNKIPMRIHNGKMIYSSELTESHYKELPMTDKIMENTFWIGIWPGIDNNDIEYVIHTIKEFLINRLP